MRATCLIPVVLFLAGLAASAQAPNPQNFDATVPLHPKVETAIAKAQQWLVAKQNKNGSWEQNNGVNAMAAIALMVNGHTPGKGEHGTAVAKAIDFIISGQEKNGFLALGRKGPMYQHALATLALSEAYGMTQNPKIREALIKAVELIVYCQHSEGGWRYHPKPMKGDLSATVMQVMALRASAEAGIYVPQETIDHAVRFIKGCWQEKQQGFSYMRGGGKKNFNRLGAGVVCLQSVGLHKTPMIPAAIKELQKMGIKKKGSHYWYGHYYASIAFYHYGGPPWKNYYPKICNKILREWGKSSHYKSILDTSWAILVMGVPYRYSPIYHR